MKLSEIIVSNEKSILYFFSKDCPTCRAQKEILQEFKLSRPEQEIFEIDTEKNQEITDLFKVKNLPHIKLLENKKIKFEASGIFSRDQLIEIIER